MKKGKWSWSNGGGSGHVEEGMEIRKDERSGGEDVEAEVEKWKSREVVQYGKGDKRKVGKNAANKGRIEMWKEKKIKEKNDK